MVKWKREPFRGPGVRGPVGAAVGFLLDPGSFDSPLTRVSSTSPVNRTMAVPPTAAHSSEGLTS